MKYFVGVDLASAVMGLVVLDEGGNLEHASRHDTKPLAKKMTTWDRYFELVSKFVTIVTPYQNDVEAIYMEGYGGAHMNTMIPAIECGTIMRVVMMQMDLLKKTFIIPPTSLKKFTTSSGNAKKDVMIAKVYQKYRFMAPDSDQADAYALAMMAVKAQSPADMLAYETEVMKKLDPKPLAI